MDFKEGTGEGGAMDHWKVLSATMVGRQEKFSRTRCSRMTKTIIFWPWWQTFNNFCFETLSFLPLSLFFLFATQKSGEAWPLGPPGVADPVLELKTKFTLSAIFLSSVIATVKVIIFWDFLIFYKIFLSPQVKRSVIFSNKHAIYELLHELLNDLRLRILEISELHRVIA